MESPSSSVRRRMWISSSRLWSTLGDQDHEEPLENFPSAPAADDDDVFSDGCVTGKIESWLLGCGPESGSETTRQQSLETLLKARNFEDELSLGADASLLSRGAISGVVNPSSRPAPIRLSSAPRQQPCQPSLSFGLSLASSCRSSTFTAKSSISEVLLLCAEDAEETLYELGFGSDEPQVTVRIPPRFLNFPSLSRGINFRLFLDSQIRRIREEDPSLSLASRFRQVQVLTEMANAFYSLYSHVSRTPLQKLATPAFSFSSSPVERIERFRSSVRSEPRSPVERLKETVSKMCLYTGGSPQTSPRKRPTSLPDVVDEVLVQRVKKSLDLERNAAGDWPVGNVERPNAAVAASAKETKLHSRTHGVKPSLTSSSSSSADTVKEANHHRIHGVKPSLTSSSSSSAETVREADHRIHAADLKSVAKVTYDRIYPQTDLDLRRNLADDWPVGNVETPNATMEASAKQMDFQGRTIGVKPSLTSSSLSSANTVREADHRFHATDLKSVTYDRICPDLRRNSADDWPVGNVETLNAASVKQMDFHGRTSGVKPSLTSSSSSSAETVRESDHRIQSADLKSVAKETYDPFCERMNLGMNLAVDVSVKQTDIHTRTHGMKPSLTSSSSSSADTVREADHRIHAADLKYDRICPQTDLDLGNNSADDWPVGNVETLHDAVDVSAKETELHARTHGVKPSLTSSSSSSADLKSVAKVTYDRICPQIDLDLGRNLAEDLPVVDSSVKQTDFYDRTNSVKPSLTSSSSSSAETVKESDHRIHTADLKSVAKVTYDRIYPQINPGIYSADYRPVGDIDTPNAAVDVSVKETKLKCRTNGVKPSPTSSSEKESDHQILATDLKSVAMVTYDRICPRIVESVHRAPFCAQHGLRTTETGSRDTSLPVLDITLTSCSSDDPDLSVQTQMDYLNPKNNNNLQQVNSFELEEVQSAGEEDFGQSETSRTTKNQHKDAVARGDSVQSDSSGYADEDLGVSLNTHTEKTRSIH